MTGIQTDKKKRVSRKTVKRRVKKAASRNSADMPAPVAHADLTSVYRARMQLVGGLLNSAFDQVGHHSETDHMSADASVRRVGQGAYLQVMGQVFAALFDLSQAIPTDELVKLSKIVAEQRRAETGARRVESAVDGAARSGAKAHAHGSDTTGRGRELPESFGDMVQQIYGVSVTDSAADHHRNGQAESGSNGDSNRN